MRIDCNFVTTVRLINNERCLIDYLRVVKQLGSEKSIKIYFE